MNDQEFIERTNRRYLHLKHPAPLRVEGPVDGLTSDSGGGGFVSGTAQRYSAGNRKRPPGGGADEEG